MRLDWIWLNVRTLGLSFKEKLGLTPTDTALLEEQSVQERQEWRKNFWGICEMT